ncbi:hypothetical protein SO802_017564 [Lithocarpus litseifolius]|uniref:Uncharacterized protein n=1 Tax=Lithocarpus litseifolius TaxID=425828 RepID=A0AAW2CJW8_9ROSI
MTSLPPRPTTLPPPPPDTQPPPSQPVQLYPPYIQPLPPPPPTFHPYHPYHPPLPFGSFLPLTPSQFFWPTSGQVPLPPLPATPVPKASYTQHLSHPSTLQPKPTPHVNPAQPPKSLQPKPKSQSGELERSSAFFRIDSKAFSLAFVGGRIDSYAIHECWGQYHGSIRGKRAVSWGKTQPNVSGPSQAQAQHTTTSEKWTGQPKIVLPRQIRVSDGEDNMRSSVWETGEGSGTHEEEEGEIPSSSEGQGCPPAAATKPDDHVSVADSLDAEPPGTHGTIVEVGLSTESELVNSPIAAAQTDDQGARFLDTNPPVGIRSTYVADSGCPDLVQSQFLVALDDLNNVRDLVTLEDDSDGSSMEEELEPSEWVRTMIKGFGTFVGFPIACCKRQCIDFFPET